MNDKISSCDECENEPDYKLIFFGNQANNFFEILSTDHWKEWDKWNPILKNKVNSMTLEELKDKRLEDIFELCGLLEEYKLTPKRKALEQKMNELNEDFE